MAMSKMGNSLSSARVEAVVRAHHVRLIKEQARVVGTKPRATKTDRAIASALEEMARKIAESY